MALKGDYTNVTFLGERCISLILLLFSKSDAYNTHNAALPLSDITGGNLSDYMQLPLDLQKTLHYFLTYAVVLPHQDL